MRKLAATAGCAYMLLFPAADTFAATRSVSDAAGSKGGAKTSKNATKAVTRKLVGADAVAGRWGSVQVTLTLQTTATSSNKTQTRYTDLGGHYTYHTSRSQFIMSQALPILRQEFLSAQNANIQMVSGASYTSQAFEQSLQSALLKASK